MGCLCNPATAYGASALVARLWNDAAPVRLFALASAHICRGRKPCSMQLRVGRTQTQLETTSHHACRACDRLLLSCSCTVLPVSLTLSFCIAIPTLDLPPDTDASPSSIDHHADILARHTAAPSGNGNAASFGSPFSFAVGGAAAADSPHTPSPLAPGPQHDAVQPQQEQGGMPGATGLSGQITPDLMALLQQQSRQIESLTQQVAELQRRVEQTPDHGPQVTRA